MGREALDEREAKTRLTGKMASQFPLLVWRDGCSSPLVIAFALRAHTRAVLAWTAAMPAACHFPRSVDRGGPAFDAPHGRQRQFLCGGSAEHRPSVLIPDGFNDSPAGENHRAKRPFFGIEHDRVDARVHIVLLPSSRLPCATRRSQSYIQPNGSLSFSCSREISRWTSWASSRSRPRSSSCTSSSGFGVFVGFTGARLLSRRATSPNPRARRARSHRSQRRRERPHRAALASARTETRRVPPSSAS